MSMIVVHGAKNTSVVVFMQHRLSETYCTWLKRTMDGLAAQINLHTFILSPQIHTPGALEFKKFLEQHQVKEIFFLNTVNDPSVDERLKEVHARAERVAAAGNMGDTVERALLTSKFV